jgi:hypothetical protein
MDSTNELSCILYIALSQAVGGRELLDSSNAILRSAIDTDRITRPDTRRAIKMLLALTESEAAA